MENINNSNVTIPKRPLIAYTQFVRERSLYLKNYYPYLKLPDLTRLCARDWNNLSEVKKQEYVQKCKNKMQVYKRRMSSLTEEQLQSLAKIKIAKRDKKRKRLIKTKRKKLIMPKHPLGAYMFYLKEKWNCPDNRNKKPSEMLPKYSKKWTKLPVMGKVKYFKMQNEAKQQYAREIARWETQMIREGNWDIIRKKSRKTFSFNHLFHIAVPIPPNSSFL